jgi:hypothetical protein
MALDDPLDAVAKPPRDAMLDSDLGVYVGGMVRYGNRRLVDHSARSINLSTIDCRPRNSAAGGISPIGRGRLRQTLDFAFVVRADVWESLVSGR